MQLPVGDYYAIQDISDSARTQKPLTVVAEYDNETEARQAKDGFRIRGCEVFTELGGKLYRVICPSELVKSYHKE